MKFHFENLGLLDQVDIELADLTLICGENNTGKTYATYAIYGFLRSWREHIQIALKGLIKKQLEEQTHIDLAKMFEGRMEGLLAVMGGVYTGKLAQVFATNFSIFTATKCIPCTTKETDYLSQPYHRSIHGYVSNRKILATLKKEANSPILDVLWDDADILRYGVPTEFIADAISDIVFAQHFPPVHISSAERTGAAIFRKELDIARTRMLKAINQSDSKDLQNPFKILQEIESDYAWPVEDNVDFVRQPEDFNKRTGELAEANPDLLQAFDNLIGGSYKVVKQQLFFQAKGASKQRFTMNEASSCIRALLDVGFYLRCRAKAGDLFIIDEPELNLHPKNQRAFARLVARMVNAGIKVMITTHSDYLIKELNTLIMLNQRTEHTKKVQQEYGYEDAELIAPERIKLYMTGMGKSKTGRGKIHTLIPANIYPDRGIEVSTFDDTIETMNAIQSEILYGGDL